jgi:hypothetical protein
MLPTIAGPGGGLAGGAVYPTGSQTSAGYLTGRNLMVLMREIGAL